MKRREKMYDEYEPTHTPEQSVEIPVTVEVSWSDSDVISQAVRNVTAGILRTHEDEIKRRVFAGLDDIVNGLLLETMEQEVTPTDQWGKPQGKPVTIRELLQRSTEKWLTTSVDGHGQEANGSIHRRHKWTRAEYLFTQVTKDSLKSRVKAVISEEIGNLDELIAAEVKAQLRRTIK
jgi:hypothetical protein